MTAGGIGIEVNIETIVGEERGEVERGGEGEREGEGRREREREREGGWFNMETVSRQQQLRKQSNQSE